MLSRPPAWSPVHSWHVRLFPCQILTSLAWGDKLAEIDWKDRLKGSHGRIKMNPSSDFSWAASWLTHRKLKLQAETRSVSLSSHTPWLSTRALCVRLFPRWPSRKCTDCVVQQQESDIPQNMNLERFKFWTVSPQTYCLCSFVKSQRGTVAQGPSAQSHCAAWICPGSELEHCRPKSQGDMEGSAELHSERLGKVGGLSSESLTVNC